MPNPNKLRFKGSDELVLLGSLGAGDHVLVRTATGFAVITPAALGGGGGGAPFTYLQWDAAAGETSVGTAMEFDNIEIQTNPLPVIDNTAKTITYPAPPDGYQGSTAYILGKLPTTGKYWFALNHDNNQGLSDLSLMVLTETQILNQTHAQVGVYGDKVFWYTGGYEEHTTLSATPGILVLIDIDAKEMTFACDSWSKTVALRAPIDIGHLTFQIWSGSYDPAATHVITLNTTNAAAAPAAVPVGYEPLDLRMTAWPAVDNGTLVKIQTSSRIGRKVLLVGDSGYIYNNSLLLQTNYDKLMRSDAPANFAEPIYVQGMKMGSGSGSPRIGDVFANVDPTMGGVGVGSNIANGLLNGGGNTMMGANLFGMSKNVQGTLAIGSMLATNTGKAYESILMGNYAGEFTGWEVFRSIIMGYMAGNNPFATDTLFTGDYATSPFSQWYDVVAIGDQALYAGRMGSEQVAIGRNAGGGDGSVTNGGDRNISIGAYAMNGNGNDGAIPTSQAVAIGSYALSAGKGNQYSVAVGDNALRYAEGIANVAVGREAGVYADGSGNTAVGDRAMRSASLLQRQYCTAIGHEAMDNYGSALNNSTAIGYGAQVTGVNQVQLGNSSTTTYVFGTVQNRSDMRDKADIRDTELGLDFILKLRPRDWRWDMREDYVDLASRPVAPELPRQLQPMPPLAEDHPDYPAVKAAHVADQERYVREMRQWALDQAAFETAMEEWQERNDISNITHDGTHKRSRYHHGLVAQELKAVLDEMGIDFGGYQDHSLSGGRDVRSIGYEELFAPMIRAVQELSSKLEATQQELAALKAELGS